MVNSPKLLLGITNKNKNAEWKRFSGDYQYHFQTFWKKRHRMPSNKDGKTMRSCIHGKVFELSHFDDLKLNFKLIQLNSLN